MALRRKVMDALELKRPRKIDADTHEAIRQSMIGCATCGRTGSCNARLNFGETDGGPAGFCPSRSVFLRLMAV